MSSYLKETSRKLDHAFDGRILTASGLSLTSGTRSTISNTLWAAASPCWMLWFSLLSRLIGSYSKRSAVVKEKKLPGVDVPGDNGRAAVPDDEGDGDAAEHLHDGRRKGLHFVALQHDAEQVLVLLLELAPSSYGSIVKAFTILWPVIVSWRKLVSLAIAFWFCTLILRSRLPKATMGYVAKGRTIKAMIASFQSR